VHDDRLAERLALFCIVQCVFVRRACNTERLRTDRRSRRFEGLHRRLRLTRLATFTRTRQLRVQLLLAAEQALPRHAHVVEHHFGGMRRLDAVLQIFLTLAQAFGVRRHHERRLTTTLQLRVDRGNHDVHVGDAAVGDPRLRAVQHPFVLGFVVHRARTQRAHVAAGVGFAHTERADLHVVGGAVTLRHPLHHLLGRAVAGDARGRETRAHDRHADAGVTPEDFFDRHRQREAARIAHCVHDEIETVETNLRRFLHDRPGEFFALVPLVCGGANHVDGELVDPILQLLLVIIEGE